MIGFGFTRARANGTSLAMLLPPVGILAVVTYARAGNVDGRFAIVLAIGFTAGATIGAPIINRGWIHPTALCVLFAVLLMYVASRNLFRPGGHARTAAETIALVMSTTAAYATLKWLGKRWEHQQGAGVQPTAGCAGPTTVPTTKSERIVGKGGETERGRHQ